MIMKNISSVLEYFPQMEVLDSKIQDQIMETWDLYKDKTFTEAEVRAAMEKPNLSPLDFLALLKADPEKFLDPMAQVAQGKRRQYFGDNVYLFSPLYIANYCENSCRYCGFNTQSGIHRLQLNLGEIEEEMKALSQSGIEEVLILTGESSKYSSVEYIGQAVSLAKKYFRVIGLEVYPANVEDYAYLHKCGADFVTVFQETYNPVDYDFYHPRGNKRSLSYRLNTQERALMGGMRGVGFGALFGLSDPMQDAFSLGYHAYLLQKKYPHGEIAISLPRIRPAKGTEHLDLRPVSEKDLFQIMLAIRIFLPFASITISTREGKEFRNLAIQYGATKVSASVDTGIGRRSGEIDQEEAGEEQFLISDTRTEKEMEEDIRHLGMTPVLSDYLYLG